MNKFELMIIKKINRDRELRVKNLDTGRDVFIEYFKSEPEFYEMMVYQQHIKELCDFFECEAQHYKEIIVVEKDENG